MRTLSALSPATVHDMRGAASALALHLQLLAVEQEDEAGRERHRRSVTIADEERRRLFTLAETFARHATVPDPAAGEFDLVATVADAVALTRPYAGQRRVSLVLESVAGPRSVHGRHDVVVQALLDLLVHVLERTPAGATVQVAVEQAGSHARVVLRGTSDVQLDAELLAGLDSATRWAGGTLEADGATVALALSATGRKESA